MDNRLANPIRAGIRVTCNDENPNRFTLTRLKIIVRHRHCPTKKAEKHSTDQYLNLRVVLYGHSIATSNLTVN